MGGVCWALFLCVTYLLDFLGHYIESDRQLPVQIGTETSAFDTEWWYFSAQTGVAATPVVKIVFCRSTLNDSLMQFCGPKAIVEFGNGTFAIERLAQVGTVLPYKPQHTPSVFFDTTSGLARLTNSTVMYRGELVKANFSYVNGAQPNQNLGKVLEKTLDLLNVNSILPMKYFINGLGMTYRGEICVVDICSTGGSATGSGGVLHGYQEHMWGKFGLSAIGIPGWIHIHGTFTFWDAKTQVYKDVFYSAGGMLANYLSIGYVVVEYSGKSPSESSDESSHESSDKSSDFGALIFFGLGPTVIRSAGSTRSKSDATTSPTYRLELLQENVQHQVHVVCAFRETDLHLMAGRTNVHVTAAAEIVMYIDGENVAHVKKGTIAVLEVANEWVESASDSQFIQSTEHSQSTTSNPVSSADGEL